MDQTLYYESPYSVYECVTKITKEPQEYADKWGTDLWYQADRISDTQVMIVFKGGQFQKMMRTQYLMELVPQEHHTQIVLHFQKELFGLPPMTSPFEIDLCMKQKLNAVRKG